MAKSNWRNANVRNNARGGAAVVWLVCIVNMFGMQVREAMAQTGPLPSPKEPTKEPIRGIIRAVETASISTELSMRIASIGYLEGDHFKKGDVLVEFDCRRPRAELAASEAQHHEMRLTLENNRILQKSHAVGRHDLDVSASRVVKAAAEAEALRVRLDQCRLLAPYDGRVLELSLHALETPQPGKPFIGIVADSRIEIDLVVPSHWVRWMVIDAPLTFAVDETGTVHQARIKRIGAAVDPISQTIKIVAAFDRATSAILSGMSGTAEFSKSGG
jgi:membrane fusion protein, multidrug efflux system